MTTTTEKQETSRYGESDFTRNEAIFEKEIKPRMRELLNLNEPFNWDKHSSKDFDKRMKRQEVLMNELEKYAYDARSMTGRILRFQMADSYAVYLVVKVNKTTCRVQWIDWCDGWQDDRLGASGSLSLTYVHDQIVWRDQLNKAFK